MAAPVSSRSFHRTTTVASHHPDERGPIARLSIEHKLPLIIGLLLVAVIVALTTAAYVEVRRTSLRLASDRLLSVGLQLRDLFEQSVGQIRAQALAVSRGRAIADWSTSRDERLRGRALAELRVVSVQPDQLIGTELRDSAGTVLLTTILPQYRAHTLGFHFETLRDAAAGDAVVFGEFRKSGDIVVFPVVAHVAGADTWIVRWRRVAGSRQAREQITQLIGSEASLFVGNATGAEWTDLEHAVARPPVGVKRPNSTQTYVRGAGQEAYLAAALPIRGTTWLMVLDFPMHNVMEPVDGFIRRMAMIAVLALAVGLAAAWMMSRRITSPLRDLTIAADAIAAGDFTHHVDIPRADELGRLGRSFEAMASQVQASRENLQHSIAAQAVVAKFGRRALVVDNIGDLLDEVVVLVARTLDVSVSGVLERRSDGSALVYRASEGLRNVKRGVTQVAITEDTQAGYTLLYREPSTVGDLTVDSRFHGSFNLRDHGIASGVTVLIPGAIQPYGVLEAHDHSPRSFNDDDVHFLQSIANVLGAAAERHRSEATSRQAQRLEAVGRLASGVAHDFNNMLTAIIGYAELMRTDLPETSALREDVNEILKAAARAAGLTRQLLVFSRQQVLQPRQVMLNDVVVGIQAMLHRLVGKDVILGTSLAADLGSIKADPGQVEQVILNLCVNARDAMVGGGVLTIETSNVEIDDIQARELALEKTGSYVMLAVTDTGTGMDAETKSRVFEPFFTTKTQEHGTGLGLATVYGIVKQSGGGIRVHSEVGQGSTFEVFLPHSCAQSLNGELAA